MYFQERWITKFQIKAGSWVFVPNSYARDYGNAVKHKLEKSWKNPDYYFHLRSGGHVKALEKHAHNHFYLHLDIKDFFGNINKSRVTRNIKPFFGYKVARSIAIESTVLLPESQFKKFILPFGFVQSPIIASLCLKNSSLGSYLNSLKTDGIVVSVYMDDIIISSNNPNILEKILGQIEHIALISRLPLNTKKTEGPSRKITSFNIELSYLKLEINDDRIIKFKTAYQKGNNHQKRGILSYIKTVNKRQLTKFIKANGMP